MNFEGPLLEGTLIRRDRKFVADVRLQDGEELSVHCANAGSLRGCAEPGSKVLVSPQTNPRIKFKHQLEIIYAGKTPVAIHAGRPAAIIAEAMGQGLIPELAGYASIRRDANRNRPTRIDLIVEGNGLRPCYLKIQQVTLADEEGVAAFPDLKVGDPTEEMQTLANLVREGNRVMYLMLVQRPDAQSFRLADAIDSEYCQQLRDTVARGVEIACYRSKVTRSGITVDCALPVNLDEK